MCNNTVPVQGTAGKATVVSLKRAKPWLDPIVKSRTHIGPNCENLGPSGQGRAAKSVVSHYPLMSRPNCRLLLKGSVCAFVHLIFLLR